MNFSYRQILNKILPLKQLRFPKPYFSEWICLVCGITLSFYYAWIMDDAYTYFRYVDNFVLLNRGLVYNPGEYVEGFSSPVWILLLILFRASHLSYWCIIRIISVLAYVVFWALAVIANRKLSNNNLKPYIINHPLINLTFTYGILSYFSSGLEAPIVQILAAGYVCFFLFPRSRVFQFMVAVSPLVRPELLLPFIIAFIWSVIKEKKAPWFLFLVSGITLGGWLIFRIYYYADFLPNTFYLKDELAIKQGLFYLYDTILPYFTLPIILFFFTLYVFLKRNGKSYNLYTQQRIMIFMAALSVIFYIIKIGGDARHFRYLSFSYCLMILSTGGLSELTLLKFNLQGHRKFILSIGLIFALFSFSCYPRQLLYHPIVPRKKHKHQGSLKINDSMLHRNSGWTPDFFSFGYKRELLNEKSDFQKNDKTIPAYRTIAGWNCLIGYKKFDYFYVHSYGLTEPFLARVDALSNRPGHKDRLIPLANDIVKIRREYGFRKGSFESAVNAEKAPLWVKNNLKVINLIENKAYNQHRFYDNFKTAVKLIKREKIKLSNK